METKNNVFIATSLDGFIADKDGGIGWLDDIPEINSIDTGYDTFTSKIDAMVMGRTTYETVLSFGIDWPYKKPVFVLSKTLKHVPKKLQGKVFLLNGTLKNILQAIHSKGFYKLYIDGGKLIQSFLKEDLIDEMVITIIPTLLGGGSPLFGELNNKLRFECVESKLFLGKILQNHFKRVRK